MIKICHKTEMIVHYTDYQKAYWRNIQIFDIFTDPEKSSIHFPDVRS